MGRVTAVILAAGYGSRLLPITRCVPKEMLPLVDRPAIDLIVEELVEAGVDRIMVITSRRKGPLDAWFDRDPELEAALAGRPDRLALAQPRDVEVVFARQRRMGGTGDALRLARSFAGSGPVVVAYPDDLFGRPNCTAQLLEIYRQTGCSVLAASDGSHLDLTRYGVLDVGPTDGSSLPLRRIVEKPPAGQAPSSLVSWGRYVFAPEFFERLEADAAAHQGPGELYHVGAVNALAAEGRVRARVVDAERFDTGTSLAYARTFIELALRRPDIGPELGAWLRDRMERGDV